MSHTPPQISQYVFWDNNTNKDCYGATLYVPYKAKKAYASAEYWKKFKKIVEIVKSYRVEYRIDGEVVYVDSVKEGSSISTYTPQKEGYTFNGWKDVPSIMPSNNLVIEGSFTANEYLLSYVVDGAIYEIKKVKCDEKIEKLNLEEKVGYSFVWENWIDKMPPKDYTIRGRYIPNVYNITYVVDGKTVQSDIVAYGTTIVLPDEPAKEGYTFSGWSEAPETMPAEDVTISGTFIVNKYLVTFVIDNEVIAFDSLEYGTAIVAPVAPEKEGHTFNGWGEVAETVPAEDVTFYGSYSVNSYLLTYVVDRGTVQSDSVAYGTTIEAIEEPTKEGYTFSGWSEVPETMPAEDVVISGSFTVNTYKVYYYVGDVLVHTAEVAYGESIPEYVYEPTAEGDEFMGWVGETYESMPAHDVTYTANITNDISQCTISNSQLTIYDLNGRKIVTDDLRKLEKGIYIVNGKKVMIK